MPTLSTLLTTTLPSLHLLTYSTLLGTTLYQTFVVTKITFKTLPRSAFTSLQKKLFPAYFKLQTVLVLLLFGTHPAWPVIIGGNRKRKGAGAGGWEIGLLAVTTGCVLLNALSLGQGVGRVMMERVHQETRDKIECVNGKGGEVSIVMAGLNKRFRRVHALSLHVNLGVAIALVGYGVVLGVKTRW